MRASKIAELAKVLPPPEKPFDFEETVLKRNELARKEVELERLAMAIEQNIVTPWVRENGFGDIDRGRFERALDQIGLAFPYKNKPKSEDIFNDQFLPPAAERKVD